MVSQRELMRPNGTIPIRRTIITNTYSTLDATAYNQRYFLYSSGSTSTEYEVGGIFDAALLRTVTTANSFESTGGTLYDQTVTTTEPSAGANGVNAGGSWVARTYLPVANLVNDTGNWCLGRPQKVQQINSSNLSFGAGITRTTDVTWDAIKCRPTQSVAEAGGALQVATDIGYDGFGNVNSTVVTGSGMDPRETTTVYSDGTYTTGQFPLSVSRRVSASFSETTQFSWDYAFGVPLDSTDPNGLISAWAYDAFARRTAETLPDGQTRSITYSACTAISGGCVGSNNRSALIENSYSTLGTLMDEVWTYLDTFDRPLMMKSRTLSGAYSRVDQEYDALGRMSRQSAPCLWSSCTTYWTTYGYDLVDRVTSASRPISDVNPTLQTSNIYYEGLTTRIVDPLSKVEKKTLNAAGQLARSQDHDGYYQDFDYDAFGNLKRARDALGNTLQVPTTTPAVASRRERIWTWGVGISRPTRSGKPRRKPMPRAKQLASATTGWAVSSAARSPRARAPGAMASAAQTKT
jgi:YD repeat-containing protein